MRVRHLSRIENGHTLKVGPKILSKLAELLDVPVDLLKAKMDAGTRPRILLRPFHFPDGRKHDEFDFALELSLRRLRGVRIVSFSNAEAALKSPLGVAGVAEFELSGAIVSRKKQLASVASLTDTLASDVIWGAEFSIPGSKTSLAHMDIVGAIARALKVSVATRPEIAQFFYSDGDATGPLSHGWAKIFRPPLTPQSARSVAVDFAQVLEEAPNNPLALTGLAIVHLNLALAHWPSDKTPEEDIRLGQNYALRAVAAAPELSEAHFALGLSHRARGSLWKAKAAFAEALNLDPSSVGAATQLAFAELLLGQIQASMKHVRDARLIRFDDPGRSFLAFVEGVALLYQEKFLAAADRLQEAVSLNETFVDPWFFLAVAHHHAGHWADAQDALGSFLHRKPKATIALLRDEQPSKDPRYQPLIENVYSALAELGLPDE